MRSAGVVELDELLEPRAGVADGIVGVQVLALIFDGSPRALDEDVVASSRAIHANLDAAFLE